MSPEKPEIRYATDLHERLIRTIHEKEDLFAAIFSQEDLELIADGLDLAAMKHRFFPKSDQARELAYGIRAMIEAVQIGGER